MPATQQILAGLGLIANRFSPVAIGWHFVVLGVVFAVALGWRPSRRIAGMILTLPLMSVSLFALLTGNPFNASVFIGATALLLVIASRFEALPVRRASQGQWFVGVGMIAFAWVYPHFLFGAPPLTYLLAAPMGLIPCPTLSLVVGVGLLLGGLDSRPWAVVVSTLGLFYGIFGAIRLDVRLDLLLVIGSLALAVRSLAPYSAVSSKRFHLAHRESRR
jgi:hypothetical protein